MKHLLSYFQSNRQQNPFVGGYCGHLTGMVTANYQTRTQTGCDPVHGIIVRATFSHLFGMNMNKAKFEKSNQAMLY